jgi:hypothetical protein
LLLGAATIWIEKSHQFSRGSDLVRIAWILFFGVIWIRALRRRQHRSFEQKRAAKTARRILAWVFLFTWAWSTCRIFGCPHATWIEFYGTGGIALGGADRPCRNPGPRWHLFGDVYFWITDDTAIRVGVPLI